MSKLRAGSEMDRRRFALAAGSALCASGLALAAEEKSMLWSRVEGAGRPIVFIHGWTMDHRDEVRTYESVFASRRGWRRHYIDLPGMGSSPAPADVLDLDGMLAAVLHYVDERVGEPFAIAGTSAGGYLARGVIARRRNSVLGALLRVPLVIPEDARRDRDSIKPLVRNPSITRNMTPVEHAQFGELLVQTPGYLAAKRRKNAEAVAPAKAAADQAFLAAIRLDPARYRFSFDVDAAIGRFDLPSLIIAGRQDESVGYRDAWKLAQAFTRSTFAVLDRGEHGLPIDQQPLVEALVADWLARVEESIART